MIFRGKRPWKRSSTNDYVQILKSQLIWIFVNILYYWNFCISSALTKPCRITMWLWCFGYVNYLMRIIFLIRSYLFPEFTLSILSVHSIPGRCLVVSSFSSAAITLKLQMLLKFIYMTVIFPLPPLQIHHIIFWTK